MLFTPKKVVSGHFRPWVMWAVLFLLLGLVSSGQTQEKTYIQKGAEPVFPDRPHIVGGSLFFDQGLAGGQGSTIGGFALFAYYPDLKEGNLIFSGIASDTTFDISLASRLSAFGKKLKYGLGLEGELLSFSSAQFVFEQGRGRKAFEFNTSFLGLYPFISYPITKTVDVTLSYRPHGYILSRIDRNTGTMVRFPPDTFAQAARLELSWIFKEMDGEGQELSGRDYSTYFEYENRDRLGRADPVFLTPLRSRNIIRWGGSLMNFLPLSPVKNQIIAGGIAWGLGSDIDFVSQFGLGSFQEGGGNTAIPGYFFSELRANRFLAANIHYIQKVTPKFKFDISAYYGIGNIFRPFIKAYQGRNFSGLALKLVPKIGRLPVELSYGYAPRAIRDSHHGAQELFWNMTVAF